MRVTMPEATTFLEAGCEEVSWVSLSRWFCSPSPVGTTFQLILLRAPEKASTCEYCLGLVRVSGIEGRGGVETLSGGMSTRLQFVHLRFTRF